MRGETGRQQAASEGDGWLRSATKQRDMRGGIKAGQIMQIKDRGINSIADVSVWKHYWRDHVSAGKCGCAITGRGLQRSHLHRHSGPALESGWTGPSWILPKQHADGEGVACQPPEERRQLLPGAIWPPRHGFTAASASICPIGVFAETKKNLPWCLMSLQS